MLSKSAWSLIIATLFAIFTWVTPVPEKWRTVLIAVSSILLLLASIGWLIAHFKEGKPKLSGQIVCLEDDARLDQTDQDYDCFITLCVKVRNSGTPTAVDSFSLNLWWGREDHPGTDEPVDGYYVQTFGREPGNERSRHAIRETPLSEFPVGEEITTTSKTGWRRFSFGSLPPAMIESGRLSKEVIIDLIALDSQGQQHTIYKATMYNGVERLIAGCGKLVTIPQAFS